MKKEVRVIQSIQRAVNILKCFSREKFELTLHQISEEVELNINTTRGLVNSLVANDMLFHNTKNNTYSIGDFFVLKSSLVMQNKLQQAKELAEPLLIDLAEQFKASSHLQIILENNIISLHNAAPKNSYYFLDSTKNDDFPLHATASGKILLKYRKKNLEDIRLKRFTEETITDIRVLQEELNFIEENGYSKEIDEIGLGISSLAVPIFNQHNEIFGTFSLTALTPIIQKKEKEIIEELNRVIKLFEKSLFFD